MFLLLFWFSNRYFFKKKPVKICINEFQRKQITIQIDRVHFVLVGQDPAAPLVESDNPEERQKQKLARAVERAKNNGTEPVLANNIHMRVKLLKTKLLKLVPSQYEYVLYVDRYVKQPKKRCDFRF